MTSKKPDLANEVVAGLAVFFSMSYVAFANPIVLSKAGRCLEQVGDKCLKYSGMPMAPVFFATCAMASLATAISASYARSPAALTQARVEGQLERSMAVILAYDMHKKLHADIH